MNQTIWIDLANSPQVLFFRPLILEMKYRGCDIHLTTRYYAQTVSLADQLNLDHVVIGEHGGSRLFGLFEKIFLRAVKLAQWARGKSFDLAVSHNSYSQALAASLLGIPHVTLMDYEHQPLNHLSFRLAHKVIVPNVFPEEMLKKFGANNKCCRYNGIKEQVYLADFSPNMNFRELEDLPLDKPLVIIRPPATWTMYHRFENNVFTQLLEYLNSNGDLCCLFLPRIAAQANELNGLKNVHQAKKVFDGPNLLYSADLVFSGGGTMNREAAVLGTPTYTFFKGKMSAIDEFLIDKGLMKQISNRDDFSVIPLQFKSKTQGKMNFKNNLSNEIIDMILE